MNTKLIRHKFEKSMATYDKNAYAQKEIAEKLHRILLAVYPYPPDSLFEIGCGTGLLTKKLLLSYPAARYFVNDMNEKVASLLPAVFEQTDYSFLPGDAQQIDYPEETDLIVSSSVIQWFTDLPLFARKAAESLSTKGYMFLSTFGCNNLKEIKEITHTGLHYPTVHALKNIFSVHFEIMDISEEEILLPFNSPSDILKHLRDTGVNAASKGVLRTRSEMQHFTDTYKSLYSHGDGVRLTYHPIYLTLKKKER
ncbi:malonyl-[acyl-carrier protein] O-methyltransferase BioC [Parabacteroides sp. 52]|uniref:malonyl-ACP O-methyltransferase BioC n=1 Tax=unclassified Parabacteroides TaxID=2649774 RepID=UPI0013D3856C|nr:MULTISPECIES: malonyl-ACP O-methyltransferase BioC [unclassified Parabacteroides]MDH6534000.1 malonyl-CoA O-methyltransferase [Parabacteroides sp. PM5-20]NDV54741.1 malonyl-[acyl-carrier protein] O-methyltransferase BioC [Parabacteroides sp. 52]